MSMYFYDGPVMEFNRCIQNNWKGKTAAVSEERAMSNLVYQWKKANNRLATANITLPGKMRAVN